MRLQAATRVRLVLGRLTDRDTLTQWYRYLTDSTSEKAVKDTSYQTRRAFIEDYFVRADLGDPGYRKKNLFPLTDFRQPYTKVLLDYLAYSMLYTITKLYDFDLNDTIDSRDDLMKSLSFGSKGGFSIDSLSKIAGDLEDSGTAANMNALIASMSSGMGANTQLAQLFQPAGSNDSAGSQDVNEMIASMGDAVLFYQFGDGLDNDGDGCIDEEIIDEKDNDLDGFVDEDARVVPLGLPDNIDNDHNGKMDPYNAQLNPVNYDSLEAPVADSVFSVHEKVLGFVHKYLSENNELGITDPKLTTWVKIKKDNSTEMPLRLAIQKDSLALKVKRAGGVVPDSLKSKVNDAKSVIGGCWRNYATP
jgi:hypothetical protein